MNLGTDGMQPHVEGSTTPANPFKRTAAGPLRKWSDRSIMKYEDQARVGLYD